MKKIILFFFLFSLKVLSQGFHQGTINYLNGDTKKGLVEITSDVLKFKDNDDAKTIKIDNALIKSVVFISATGKKYVIERIKRQFRESSTGKYVWLQLLQQGGYYDLYVAGDGYSFDKEGNLIATSSYVTNRTLPSFVYYIRKFDQENAVLFSISSGIGTEKIFRNNCKKYLSDDAELMARIESKELEKTAVEFVIDSYNKFKKKKS